MAVHGGRSAQEAALACAINRGREAAIPLAGYDRNAVEMAGAHRRSFDRDDAATLEDAVRYGFGEVRVVQHTARLLERLGGHEGHRSGALVTLADHMEEDVGGVGAVGAIATWSSTNRAGFAYWPGRRSRAWPVSFPLRSRSSRSVEVKRARTN